MLLVRVHVTAVRRIYKLSENVPITLPGTWCMFSKSFVFSPQKYL